MSLFHVLRLSQDGKQSSRQGSWQGRQGALRGGTALWGLPSVLGVQLQPSLLYLYLYLSSGGPQTPSLPPSHTNSAPAAPGSSRTAPRDRHGSSHRPQAQTLEISQVPRHPEVLPARHCEQPHHPSRDPLGHTALHTAPSIASLLPPLPRGSFPDPGQLLCPLHSQGRSCIKEGPLSLPHL